MQETTLAIECRTTHLNPGQHLADELSTNIKRIRLQCLAACKALTDRAENEQGKTALNRERTAVSKNRAMIKDLTTEVYARISTGSYIDTGTWMHIQAALTNGITSTMPHDHASVSLSQKIAAIWIALHSHVDSRHYKIDNRMEQEKAEERERRGKESSQGLHKLSRQEADANKRIEAIKLSHSAQIKTMDIERHAASTQAMASKDSIKTSYLSKLQAATATHSTALQLERDKTAASTKNEERAKKEIEALQAKISDLEISARTDQEHQFPEK
jgi:hypothetical protein